MPREWGIVMVFDRFVRDLRCSANVEFAEDRSIVLVDDELGKDAH